MSLTKVTYSMIEGAPVNVLNYGADESGTNNSAAAIQAALAASDNVFIPTGTYRCDAMIEINAGKTLQLAPGATLSRLSAHSASTDPVVWIKGSNAALIGAGQRLSTIVTQNRAPKGVVRLGHKDMTESHANVNYCTLNGFSIRGSTANGQTTGDLDVCLYMPNPQFSGLTSYFHNVSDLALEDANFGLWLHGFANANLISKLQGYRLGNTTLGVNTNAMIFISGAQDNSISQFFFHQSTDSIGVLVDTADNSPNGGVIHYADYNTVNGGVCEQGGASALGLKAIACNNSYFQFLDNVAGGNNLFANFFNNNALWGIGGGTQYAKVFAATPKVEGSTVAGTATYTTQTIRYTYVGKVVFFELRLVWSGGTGSGNLLITGLPFNAGNYGTFPPATISLADITLTAGSIPVGTIESNAAFIRIQEIPSGGGATLNVPYDAAGAITLSGHYLTA